MANGSDNTLTIIIIVVVLAIVAGIAVGIYYLVRWIQGVPPAPSCNRDIDCEDTKQCEGGSCVTHPCEAMSECHGGYRCTGGQFCERMDRCGSNAACPPGSFCLQGYCIQSYDRCTETQGCNAQGAICIDGQYCIKQPTYIRFKENIMQTRTLLTRFGDYSAPDFLGLTINPKNQGALLTIIRAPPPEDAFFWIFTDNLHFLTRYTSDPTTNIFFLPLNTGPPRNQLWRFGQITVPEFQGEYGILSVGAERDGDINDTVTVGSHENAVYCTLTPNNSFNNDNQQFSFLQ